MNEISDMSILRCRLEAEVSCRVAGWSPGASGVSSGGSEDQLLEAGGKVVPMLLLAVWRCWAEAEFLSEEFGCLAKISKQSVAGAA